jgi:V8-like Glu-specific endopeptidase
MNDRNAAVFVALMLAALTLPATALALGLRAAAHRRSPTASTMPTASTSTGVPQIGALYPNALAASHGCTASVVASPGGNTLITAAHCVAGTGIGMVFVPGQRGAQAPYGRWTVTAVHVESVWTAGQASRADVAFLTVGPRTVDGRRLEVEQVTGANKLGPTAVPRQRVTVAGYPSGSANNPVTCTTTVYLTDGFPTVDCRGFVGGTSGSPWLLATPSGSEIVGIIGGPHQGGCFDYTSYSSPLARDADTAYLRASADARGDVAPQPGGDGC